METDQSTRRVRSPGEQFVLWAESSGYQDYDSPFSKLYRRTGYVPDYFFGIIDGLQKLDWHYARELSRLTGIPTQMWLTWEEEYRAEIAEMERIADSKARKTVAIQEIFDGFVASVRELTLKMQEASEMMREALSILNEKVHQDGESVDYPTAAELLDGKWEK